MRESSAPDRTRKTCGPLTYDGERNAKQSDALDDVGHRPGHDKSASPIPNGARTDTSLSAAATTAIVTRPTAKAPINRCATPRISPRFHARSGPNGMANSSGTKSGPNVRLKNGGPTEIFAPVIASSASG